MKLIPIRYRLPWTHYINGDTLHMFASIDATNFDAIGNPTKWCVREGGSCLNDEGEFEYEPNPSSRDDDFLKRTRFDSAEEAYRLAEKWMKNDT